MSILPGNPYGTASNVSPHEGENDGDWTIAQATLALAYEQRTATLVQALLSDSLVVDGKYDDIQAEVRQRLGLGAPDE